MPVKNNVWIIPEEPTDEPIKGSDVGAREWNNKTMIRVRIDSSTVILCGINNPKLFRDRKKAYDHQIARLKTHLAAMKAARGSE